MLYILALISVKVDRNWSIAKTALAFVISLIPFGAFFFDKSLRKEESLIKEEEEVVVAE
jgi:integral membrane protein